MAAGPDICDASPQSRTLKPGCICHKIPRCGRVDLANLRAEDGPIAIEKRIQFDRFLLDRDDERVIGPDGPLHLGNKAYQVLDALIDCDGKLLTKDTLFDTVWDGTHVSESALTSVIKELRRALGDTPRNPRIIENVYGRGYRFIAQTKLVDDRARVDEAASAKASAQLEEPLSRAPLLAVMAFDNYTADAELDFFCDGISEEIQRTVASGSSLKVVARASSFQFRGAAKDTAHVASALEATHLLDGSVRRSQNRVRISAELVECDTRSAIWADRFDGDLDEVFDLQERIAERVAEALKVALVPARKEVTLDPASYEAYMRARGIMAEGDPLFDDAYRESIPLLETVVAAAPNFAPAWESLAECRAWTLRSGRYEKAYHVGRDGVIEAAHTALRLDPKSGGAYVALAMLEPWGAYSQREALLNQALEVSPRDTAALTDMSTFCWSVGRFRDGLRYAEHACELNPLMPSARLNVAQMRAYVGDIDLCVASHEQLHRQWPDNPGILISLVNTAGTLGYWDAFDRAVPDVGQLNEWQSRDMRSVLAFARAVRTKDPDLVERRMKRYRDYLDKTGRLPLNLIVSIGEFGLPEEALDMAEKASYDFVFNPDGARPSTYFPGTILGPWSKVLQIPRFVDLCTRLGMSDYWNSTGNWPDCEDWVCYDFRAKVKRSLADA